MKPWKRTIFRRSPLCIRKVLANLEAVKRNGTRHGGDYKKHYENIDMLRILSEDHPDEKLERLNALLAACRTNIPCYRESIPTEELTSVKEIVKLPLLRKDDLRNDLQSHMNPKPVLGFWHGTTGGTSGKLDFARDLRSLHYEYALYDRLYDFAGGKQKVKKARFSNVPITETTSHTPPFWMEVSKMNQLQCSIYHLDENSFGAYLQAIAEYGADIGTGYAFLWHRLAEEALEHKDDRLKLRAVVPDSEGMTEEQKRMVEKAFDCRVYQTYGTSEVGMIAVQCEQGHYHILDRVHVEVVDDQGEPVPDGTDGEIVVTDLWSTDAPFLRYCPEDRGVLQSSGCPCGWQGPYLEKLTGRVRDYIVTAEGRKVNHTARIMEGIPGVRVFQYIQDEPGQLHIRIEIREGFDPVEMKWVHKNARKMIGEMRITWEVVEQIEKSPSGKIKTVIRNFE
jgi:phenylacetate-CoA ligase